MRAGKSTNLIVLIAIAIGGFVLANDYRVTHRRRGPILSSPSPGVVAPLTPAATQRSK